MAKARPWTLYEREFLRLTHGVLPTERIAQHLGRSRIAIWKYVHDCNRRERARRNDRPAILDVLPPPSRHAPPWIPGRGTAHS